MNRMSCFTKMLEYILKIVAFFVEFFFFFFGHTHGMWKFLGHGSNLSHSSDLRHCSDNARSITHCTVREVHVEFFFVCVCRHVFICLV